jgi:CspA family cold shock protein
MEGTVKWFNEAKGYGFITTDDGTDVFVHHTSIVAQGFRTLEANERVSFEIKQSPKGPQAQNVVRLEK